MSVRVVAAIWSVLVGMALLPGRAGEPAPDRAARLTPTVKAVAQVLPAVVNISTERIVDQRLRRYGNVDPFADFFNQFFGARDQHYKTSSLGSGVIIDPAGLILTNDHVVLRASRILVTLADGTNHEATPVATDEANDLALLQLEGLPPETRLTAIAFARPDDLLLGETVITVGNPFGLGHSVASGVLSAVGRKAIYNGEVLFDDILQTDAAINPGNSGGPLVNLNGELIGVNLAIQRDAEGIGFAIPVRRLEEVLANWLLPARFTQAIDGLIPGTRITGEGQCEAIVKEIRPDTPAARAGVQPGNVIKRCDGHPVRQAIDVSRLLWRHRAGDTVKLELGDGRTISYVLEPIPRMSGQELARERLQVELQELTPRLAAALKLPYSRGLVVSDIDANGLLARRGLQKGDVIIQVGAIPVSDFADLSLACEHLHAGDVVELVVDRVVERMGRYFLQRFVVEIPFHG